MWLRDPNKKDMNWRNQIITKGMRSAICIAPLLSFLSIPATSQWRHVQDFPYGITAVHVFQPKGNPERTVIVVAHGDKIPFGTLGISISTDDGKTWQEASCPLLGGYITDFSFKDASTGWAAVGEPADCPAIFETTDGGFNWTGSYYTPTLRSGVTGVYWNSASNRLFMGNYFDVNLGWSSDEGVSWNFPIPVVTTGFAGFVFKDANVGIACTDYPEIYRTLDGGNTWVPSFLPSGAGSGFFPAIMPDSNTFVIEENLGQNGYRHVYLSQDSGSTWRTVSSLPGLSSGQAVQDGGKLYTSIGAGVEVSEDTGHTWWLLCAPVGTQFCTPVAVANGTIYYGDGYGHLWVNRSGLPAGPRFSIRSSSSVSTTTITLRTPHSFWNGFTADSVSVRLVFNTAALSEKSVSLAPGWSVSYVEPLADGARFHFVRTTANIEPDSSLATITFQTYLTSESSPTIALDEINWDRDTTFRDCMVSALSASDTVRVNLQLSCEDSILLFYMKTGTIPLRIESIQPNPAREEVVVTTHSSSGALLSYEVFDALGRGMVSGSVASTSFSINVKSFPSGTYYLRVSGGGFVETKRIAVGR